MSKELIKIEGIEKMPQMLQSFEARSSRVEGFFIGLEEAIKKDGMSPEVDSKLQEFIVAVKKTGKEFNEGRSPYTKRMDEIKKMFTHEENRLKAVIAKSQKYRDSYAKKVAEDNAKAQRESEVTRLKEEERVNLTANIEKEIKWRAQEKMDAFKMSLVEAMKTVTKDNLEKKKAGLQGLNVALDPKFFSEFKTKYSSQYGNDVAAIVVAMVKKLKKDVTESYDKEMNTYKQECLMMIRDISEAEDKEDIIKEQSDNIALESAASKEITDIQVDSNKEAALAEVAFNSTMEVVQDVPESRKGYEIKVLNKAGYAALVAYWFSMVASEFSGDMVKKTVGSMIKDLEKHAHKTGEQLMNDSIKYEVIYKAVNRAS